MAMIFAAKLSFLTQGRDMGFMSVLSFYAKISMGNAEQAWLWICTVSLQIKKHSTEHPPFVDALNTN